MKRKPHLNRFGVEKLEDRSLLAGNVTASVSGGSLFINGDGAGNTITVESFGVDTVQVRGFGTTVNGTAAIKTFHVTGSINMTMNGGDDVVRVTNLVVHDNLSVGMGEGSNTLLTGQSAAGDNLQFGGTPSGALFVQGNLGAAAGSGADRLFQSNTHVQGTGTVALANNNDTIQMDRPAGSSENVEYTGFLSLKTGAGSDNVSIVGLVTFDSMEVVDSNGPTSVSINSMDVHGALTMVTGSQADNITVQNTNVHTTFTVNTDGAADNVSLSCIADVLVISSTWGNDQFHISSANINHLTSNTGAGDDQLDILSSEIDRIDAFGSDNADLFLVRNTHAIDAFFHGDAGFDTYQESNALPNNISNLQLFSIERRQKI